MTRETSQSSFYHRLNWCHEGMGNHRRMTFLFFFFRIPYITSFLTLLPCTWWGKAEQYKKKKVENVKAICFVQPKSCFLKLLETRNAFSTRMTAATRLYGAPRLVTTWNLVIGFVEDSICLLVLVVRWW